MKINFPLRIVFAGALLLLISSCATYYKRDAWGNYIVSGDQITLIRVGGIKPRHCGGNAVYHFKRVDFDTLQFTLVHDRCTLRKKNVLAGWKRQ